MGVKLFGQAEGGAAMLLRAALPIVLPPGPAEVRTATRQLCKSFWTSNMSSVPATALSFSSPVKFQDTYYTFQD